MTKNLTWPAVVLVAVLGGLAVALLSLTNLTSGEVLGIIGVLAGIGGGAALAAAPNGTAARVEEIHAETTRQTETIETIERRTNGELDARIAAAMEEAAETGAARAIAAMQGGPDRGRWPA